MATPEGSLTAANDVTVPPANSASTATDSSSASQGTSSASTPDAPAGNVAADVQGADTSQPDPFADLPSVEELNQQAEQGVKYAKALANLRGVIDPLRTQHQELTQKFTPFQPLIERFEKPEQLQSALELQDSLFAWENDPQTGQPIPSTKAAAQLLDQHHAQHANDLVAELLEMPTLDSVTGARMPRWEIVLHGIAEDPTERAAALKILGGVEPTSIAPQWQPTEDELSVVKEDLRDFYRTLPYEDRVELKENSPEFINKTLQQLKLNQDLQAERTRYQQVEQQRTEQREQYIAQQAQQAGDTYVTQQLNEALTTFHNSVVQQCNFLQPIDFQQLPQGMTAEQAQQVNAQVAATNKAEAAQITGMIVSLFNPQTSAYVIPLLREIGAVDDKLLAELDKAAHSFGNNARNFGNLNYRGQLTANGAGYTPDAGVTQLNNEASRALKSMLGYANQIKGRMIEQRSKFFELRAQQHNNTLNGSAAVRPPVNGTGFNPTTANAPNAQPSGWLSRDEIARQFG